MSDAVEVGIKVVCRVRPTLLPPPHPTAIGTSAPPSSSSSSSSANKAKQQREIQNLVQCVGTQEVVVGLGTDQRSFVLDYVAPPSATQQDLWDHAGLEVCQSSLNGYHGTLIAYGQTGSGKTHTIFGDERGGDEAGIVPRALDYIFTHTSSEQLRTSGGTRYAVTVQYVEIYNERVYDLLEQQQEAGRSIQLREDTKRGVFVEGAVEEEITSSAQAHALLELGNKNRHVASTVMNRTSSRSHAVFMLTIQMTHESPDAVKTQRLSRFNLVDLAGSERQKSTQTTGVQLREAGQINKSLSALGNVIHALTSSSASASSESGGSTPAPKAAHVSYRDSKLTFLLRDSLGGNSKTVIVATVTTLEASLSETLTTLKFAVRAKRVKNKVTRNEEVAQGTLLALQREVLALRARLEEMQGQDQQALQPLALALSSPSTDAGFSSPGAADGRRRAVSASGLQLASPKSRAGHADYREALTAALVRCQAADELRLRAELKAREYSRELDSYCSILSYKTSSSTSSSSPSSSTGAETGSVDAIAAAALEVSTLKAALEEVQRRMRWTMSESESTGRAVTQNVWGTDEEAPFSHEVLARMQEERAHLEAATAAQQQQTQQQLDEAASACAKEVAGAQARVTQMESLVQALSTELQAAQSEAKEDQNSARERLREATQKLAFMSTLVQELQHDKERAEAARAQGDSLAELQALRAAKDELWLELVQGREDWSKVRGELEGVIGDIYAEKGETEAQLQRSESQAAEVTSQLELLITKHESSRQELQACQQRLVQAVELAQQLSKESQGWDEKVRGAEAAERDAQVQLEQKDFEVQDLRDQLDSLLMQHSASLHEREALQAAAAERDECIARLEAELRALGHRHQALVDSHSSSTASKEERERHSQEALLESMGKCEALQREVVAAGKAREEAEAALQSALTEASRLEAAARQTASVLGDYQQSLERARHASSALQAQADDLKANNDSLLTEVLDARRAADAAEADLVAAESARAQAAAELQAGQERLAGLIMRAEQDEAAAEALQAQTQQQQEQEQQKYQEKLSTLENHLAVALARAAELEGVISELRHRPPPAAAAAAPADNDKDGATVAELRKQLADSTSALETSQLTVKMAVEMAQKEVAAAKKDASEARDKAARIERLHAKQAFKASGAGAEASGAPAVGTTSHGSSDNLLSAPLPAPRPLTPSRESTSVRRPSEGIGAGMASPLPVYGVNGNDRGITWGLQQASQLQLQQPSVPLSLPLPAPPAPDHHREPSAEEVLAEFGFTPTTPRKSANAPPEAVALGSLPFSIAVPVQQSVVVVQGGGAARARALPPDDGLDDEGFVGVVSHPPGGGGGGGGGGIMAAGRALSTMGLGLGGSVLEGEISARISTRTFILKEWQTTWWVIRDGELLLYRNQMDFRYNPSGTQVKKRVALRKAVVRVQALKAKEYEQGFMHNFMLDEEHDWGLEHLVKFASSNKAQVTRLYEALKVNLR